MIPAVCLEEIEHGLMALQKQAIAHKHNSSEPRDLLRDATVHYGDCLTRDEARLATVFKELGHLVKNGNIRPEQKGMREAMELAERSLHQPELSGDQLEDLIIGTRNTDGSLNIANALSPVGELQ